MEGMIKKTVPGSVQALIKQLFLSASLSSGVTWPQHGYYLSLITHSFSFQNSFPSSQLIDVAPLSPSCIINTPLQLVGVRSGGLWHIDGPICTQN